MNIFLWDLLLFRNTKYNQFDWLYNQGDSVLQVEHKHILVFKYIF